MSHDAGANRGHRGDRDRAARVGKAKAKLDCRREGLKTVTPRQLMNMQIAYVGKGLAECE